MKSTVTAMTLLTLAVTATSVAPAFADCQSDIDKVEYAIDHSNLENLKGEGASETSLRQLLEAAVKQKSAGDEAKCQDLIDKAKYMGNIE